MSVHVIRPRRRRREEGIALVVVLLFTAVVLTIVVSTTATLALGARGGGVNERAAYQALLAAESGLNTFLVRLEAVGKYPPASNQSALDAWVNVNSELMTYRDSKLDLKVAAPGTITVRSKGTIPGGGSKTVLQDFKMNSGKGFKFRPRSAFSSVPPIDANNGTGSISGEANDGVVAKVGGSSSNTAAGNDSITLSLNSLVSANTPITSDEMSGLLKGDYIRVDSSTFRIDSKNETSISVTRVTETSTAVPSLNANVELMLNAVASDYSAVTDSMRIRVSNYGDFIEGEEITIDGRRALVTKVGPDLHEETGMASNDEYIEIRWMDMKPTTLHEGTQILRDITALRSTGEITNKSQKVSDYSMDGDVDCSVTGKGGNASTDCQGDNDLLLKKDTFTKSLFGITDDELEKLIPLKNVDASFKMNGDIIRINASDLEKVLTSNPRSSGILIVDGDVTSQINGGNGFDGFIYFRGSLTGKFNGSAVIDGGIAVRGGSQSQLTGNVTVKYNAVKLRRYFINNGVNRVESVQGTWRQQ